MAVGNLKDRGIVMEDSDWLTREFEETEREYRALPENARPVVVPPPDVTEPGPPNHAKALDSKKFKSRSK